MNKNLFRVIQNTNLATALMISHNARQRAKNNSSSSSYVTSSGKKKNTMYVSSDRSEQLPKVDYEVITTIDPSSKISHANVRRIAPDIAEFIDKIQSLFTAEIDKTYLARKKEVDALSKYKENLEKVYALKLYPQPWGKDEKTGKKTFKMGGVIFTEEDIKADRNLFQANIDELNKNYPDLMAKREESIAKVQKYLKYGVLLDWFKKLESKYYDAKNEYNLYESIRVKLEELKEYAGIFDSLTPDDKKNILQVFEDYSVHGLSSADVDNNFRNDSNYLSRLYHCKTSTQSVQEYVNEAHQKMLDSLSPEEKSYYENIGEMIRVAFKSLPQQELAKLPTRTEDLYENINKNSFVKDLIYIGVIEELEKDKSVKKEISEQGYSL